MVKPLVSVVIPCFRVWRFLEEAVQSVKKQSYLPTEIILVNDGCLSQEGEKVRKKLSFDRSLQIIERPHQGVSAARNYGINEARGTYIVCLDADDILHQSYIEKAVAAMESDSSLGLVVPRVGFIGYRRGEMFTKRFSIASYLIENYFVVSSMFRKSDWAILGGFDPMFSVAEDYEFFIGLLKLGRNVRQLDEILFSYRIHQDSSCAMHNHAKFDEAKKSIIQKHSVFFQKYFHEILAEATIERAQLIKQLVVVDSLHRLLRQPTPVPVKSFDACKDAMAENLPETH